MLWRAGLWSQRQGGSSMCISCCFLLLGARHWQLLLHLLLPSLCWARLETSSLGCFLEGKGVLRLLLPLLTLAESETLTQSKAPGRTWSPAGTCAFRHRCVCTSGCEQSCAHLLLSSCTWPCCVLLPRGRNPSAGVAALVNVQRSSFALHQKQMNKH